MIDKCHIITSDIVNLAFKENSNLDSHTDIQQKGSKTNCKYYFVTSNANLTCLL